MYGMGMNTVPTDICVVYTIKYEQFYSYRICHSNRQYVCSGQHLSFCGKFQNTNVKILK